MLRVGIRGRYYRLRAPRLALYRGGLLRLLLQHLLEKRVELCLLYLHFLAITHPARSPFIHLVIPDLSSLDNCVNFFIRVDRE